MPGVRREPSRERPVVEPSGWQLSSNLRRALTRWAWWWPARPCSGRTVAARRSLLSTRQAVGRCSRRFRSPLACTGVNLLRPSQGCPHVVADPASGSGLPVQRRALRRRRPGVAARRFRVLRSSLRVLRRSLLTSFRSSSRSRSLPNKRARKPSAWRSGHECSLARCLASPRPSIWRSTSVTRRSWRHTLNRLARLSLASVRARLASATACCARLRCSLESAICKECPACHVVNRNQPIMRAVDR